MRNNSVYQKQHHRVVARPTSYSVPATSRTCHLNHQHNVDYDWNYSVNQNNYVSNNNRPIVQKDFNEYDRSLNDYNNNNIRRNNYTYNQENLYNNHNVCNCQHSFYGTNNYDINTRRNNALHNNINYYQNNDNLIDYHDSDLRWKGILPSDHYKNLVGPNSHVVHKKPVERVQLNQRVDVKHFVPPSTPPPG